MRRAFLRSADGQMFDKGCQRFFYNGTQKEAFSWTVSTRKPFFYLDFLSLLYLIVNTVFIFVHLLVKNCISNTVECQPIRPKLIIKEHLKLLLTARCFGTTVHSCYGGSVTL